MLDWHSRARAIRRRFASEHPMVLHTWLYEAHNVGLIAARAWPKTKKQPDPRTARARCTSALAGISWR